MSNPHSLSRFDRLLPLSGVAFAALMVAGAAAFPLPPGGDGSPAGQPAWLSAHATAVIAQDYVRGMAAIAFVGLTAAVAAAVRRATPEGSALPGSALLGGALTGGLVLLAQAVGLAAALFGRTGGAADTVRALGRLQDAVLDMSSVPAVLLFAAVGIASHRTGLLPRWLTAATLLGVPFALLDAGSYSGGPLEAIGLLGLLYFLAWAVLVGVRLTFRSPGGSPAQEGRVATASA